MLHYENYYWETCEFCKTPVLYTDEEILPKYALNTTKESDFCATNDTIVCPHCKKILIANKVRFPHLEGKPL